MVINSVKCFGHINRTNVGCIPALDHVVNNQSTRPNGKTTSTSFHKSKLAVRCNEKGFKFINNTVFKNFGYNWTDGDASEIIADKGFTITILWFRDGHDVG